MFVFIYNNNIGILRIYGVQPLSTLIAKRPICCPLY